MSKPMAGKVCLVTGAASGIGKATAKGLAERGATVLLVGRGAATMESLRAELSAQTGNADVHVHVTDLAVQASIRELAKEVLARHEKLHVLVNNAGVQRWERHLTAEGIEETLAVNHLAPYLLTRLLLPALGRATSSRVVNVSSRVHLRGRIDLEDFRKPTGTPVERPFDSDRAYAQSKLANLLFTYELARRSRGTGVCVNAVHPGMVRTSFARDFRGFKRVITALVWPFLRSPQKGAETVLHAAASEEVEGATGHYFVNRHAKSSSRLSLDEKLAVQVWEASARLTGLPP